MTFAIWLEKDELVRFLDQGGQNYFVFAGFVSQDQVLVYVRDQFAATTMFQRYTWKEVPAV